MSAAPEHQTTHETSIAADASTGGAAEFVARFADAWARPTPERLVALLHPDVRLYAPLTAPTVGLESARDEFRRVFGLFPDLRGEVHRWSASAHVVFIEFTLSATLAGRPLRWHAVDRFLLAGGRGLERVSYFDSAPLALALVMHPSAWLRWWRSGLGPLLSRRRLLKRR